MISSSAFLSTLPMGSMGKVVDHVDFFGDLIVGETVTNREAELVAVDVGGALDVGDADLLGCRVGQADHRSRDDFRVVL